METEEHDIDRADEGKPPFVSSWNRLYLLVLVNLGVLIGLFYVFMKAFE
jgi:hypothetical protein